jgi:predicted lysophospholipase L1 biosynthesis ABC-type transport system permease subunit
MRPAGDGSQTSNQQWLTVVGVTPKTPVLGLMSDWEEFIVYYPSGHPGTAVTVRAQAGVDPRTDLRRLAENVGAGLALPRITRVEDALSESIATQRFTMTLLTIFAGLAVVLSAVGLYGVVAYLVAERTREIGIRMALGGTWLHIVKVVTRRAIALSILGLVIGLLGARWAALGVRSMLYGVTPLDLPSYLAVLLLLLAVSVLACLLPLRRAVRIDPLVAIRTD